MRVLWKRGRLSLCSILIQMRLTPSTGPVSVSAVSSHPRSKCINNNFSITTTTFREKYTRSPSSVSDYSAAEKNLQMRTEYPAGITICNLLSLCTTHFHALKSSINYRHKKGGLTGKCCKEYSEERCLESNDDAARDIKRTVCCSRLSI